MPRLEGNTIRLYTRDTERGKDIYPTLQNERVPRTQNATWPRRVVTGPVSADAEEFLASWTQDDYSGGFGILDANETTDTSRIAFGIIDARRPRSMCPPPQTDTITKPSWASNAMLPLGDIGTQFYAAWEEGIAGFDDANDAYYTTQNQWPTHPTDFVLPTTDTYAVPFAGYLCVAGGSQGTVFLTETTPGTGTLTVTSTTDLDSVVLALHDGKLWALDTSGYLWSITPAGAASSITTIGNWTRTNLLSGDPLILDTSLDPMALFSWWNAAQEESLWVVTQGQGGYYVLDPAQPAWIRQKVRPGSHPQQGITVDTFREGEDLFIAGGGLDLTRLTVANVEVPLSGPSKDQGVPTEYASGQIVDLCAERSSLYALIDAGTSVAAGSPTSTWTKQAVYGRFGKSAGLLDDPQQVAVDSSGNVYVADRDNFRVQKFNSSGVLQGTITSLTGGTGVGPTGVAVDSSGNVYVAFNRVSLRKYNSSFVQQWEVTFGIGATWPHHLATDNTYLYFTDILSDAVYKRNCSNGAAVTSWGTTGTGNSEFDGPTGIAFDGTNLYVADSGNDRIQKFQTDGTYLTQWGSYGFGDNQFDEPRGLVSDDSGDIWTCDYGNGRLIRHSNTGTYQAQFKQSFPMGVGRASGDILWVSSRNHTLAKWDEESVATPAVACRTWLGAWTGTAWTGLWDAADTVVPTKLYNSLVGDPSLFWGDTNGVTYRQLVPPPFFNPAARVTLGAYPFQMYAWMDTVRFDANMSGWDKLASHFFAMMEYAAPDAYVNISYRTDADQYTEESIDPAWRSWKRVDHIGRTRCWFDDAEDDPASGLPWREGEPFQWIQFRYEFYSSAGGVTAPIWMWHSLHYVPIPQDASSFVFKIPLKQGKTYNRTGDEMAHTLREMQRLRKFVTLQIGNPDPRHPEHKVFFRGKVIKVVSELYVGADNSTEEAIVVNFIEMESSDNEHTAYGVTP